MDTVAKFFVVIKCFIIKLVVEKPLKITMPQKFVAKIIRLGHYCGVSIANPWQIAFPLQIKRKKKLLQIPVPY